MNEIIGIMVIGYQSQTEERGIILDFVETIEEAEDKDDAYHKSCAYTDFVECTKLDNGKYSYEDIYYKINDVYVF